MVNHTLTRTHKQTHRKYIHYHNKEQKQKSILVKAREEKQDILIRKFCISNVKETMSNTQAQVEGEQVEETTKPKHSR